MKPIYSRYDKKKIAALPRVVFEGKIHVVYTKNEAQKAVDFLLGQKVVGIDTETRPTFKKGRTNLVALLQVSTENLCFLFRLTREEVIPYVVQLLENQDVLKVGLSLSDDFLSLRRRFDFKGDAFFDLQKHFCEIGIKDMALQKLYANVFGMRITKGQQMSNWEAEILTDSQKLYAATDAWACLRLYHELQRLKSECDFELIHNEYEENILEER